MPVYNSPTAPGPQPPALVLRLRGPILAVEISIPAALLRRLTQQGQPPPAPQSGLALIDTGASLSAVDDEVVRTLGIAPVGQTQIHTAGGIVARPLYPMRFSFPGTALPPITFRRVAGGALQSQGVVALLGRDMLANFILVYNGPAGTFSLAVWRSFPPVPTVYPARRKSPPLPGLGREPLAGTFESREVKWKDSLRPTPALERIADIAARNERLSIAILGRLAPPQEPPA